MPSLCMLRLAVCAVVLLLVLQAVTAQNYHFSNGWHAGKKRSSGDSTGCGFRKEVLALINKFILEETSRVAHVCQSSNMAFSQGEGIASDSDNNQLADKRWK